MWLRLAVGVKWSKNKKIPMYKVQKHTRIQIEDMVKSTTLNSEVLSSPLPPTASPLPHPTIRQHQLKSYQFHCVYEIGSNNVREPVVTCHRRCYVRPSPPPPDAPITSGAPHCPPLPATSTQSLCRLWPCLHTVNQGMMHGLLVEHVHLLASSMTKTSCQRRW